LQGIAPATEAASLLSAVNNEAAINTLLKTHADWWKDYWMQSWISLDIADTNIKSVQQYYYISQYILGCCVKEGYIAPGLYGHWHTTDNAMWGSDYHLNYNFISTFYGVASSNRPSQLLPAAEAMYQFMPQGKAFAASPAELKKLGNQRGPTTYVQDRINA